MPDPGHARGFGEQCHQVARVGDLDSSRGKPFRRPLPAGVLGECHASQLYVGTGTVVSPGTGDPAWNADL